MAERYRARNLVVEAVQWHPDVRVEGVRICNECPYVHGIAPDGREVLPGDFVVTADKLAWVMDGVAFRAVFDAMN